MYTHPFTIIDLIRSHGDPVFDNSAYGLRAEDFTFLQSTGLTDKNGKEIFEGDIVYSHHVSDKKAGPVVFSNIHHSYIIDYPKRGTREQWQEMHGKEHCYEVIGNIYENPELLPTT